DTETTSQLGYDYYGSRTDWSGFDNGQRDLPPALADFFASGEGISSGNVDTQAIASQLVNGRNAVVQTFKWLPPNGSLSFSAGTSFDMGGTRLGLIMGCGYSRRWQNRDAVQQTSGSADLSTVDSDFHRVTTDQRMVVNGLLGLGLEFGPNTIRWTNLYIRDTIKHTRMGLGSKNQTAGDYSQQDTAWDERQ